MRLGFYAPMKPPDHPVPSGDRAIARALIAALRSTGAQVDVASTLRTRDGKGEVATQSRLHAEATREIDRLTAHPQARKWQAWITYHNYYKAPDLIGPRVAAVLGIPYVQIESTRARKRLTGPWAGFAEAAEAATDAAAVVFYFSNRDAEALRRDAPEGQRLIHLQPFLNRTDLPAVSASDGPVLSVGMMRDGDKLASYETIAETMAQVRAPWQLEIAGDGPARAQVEQLMASFGGQVQFLGQLNPDDLHRAYARASVFFWPGVNEALGMVFLEAQAAGLPVVAQDRPGMRDVLAPGLYPSPEAGTTPLAQRLTTLLQDKQIQTDAGRTARAFIGQKHLLPHAAETLLSALAPLGVHP